MSDPGRPAPPDPQWSGGTPAPGYSSTPHAMPPLPPGQDDEAAGDAESAAGQALPADDATGPFPVGTMPISSDPIPPASPAPSSDPGASPADPVAATSPTPAGTGTGATPTQAIPTPTAPAPVAPPRVGPFPPKLRPTGPRHALPTSVPMPVGNPAGIGSGPASSTSGGPAGPVSPLEERNRLVALLSAATAVLLVLGLTMTGLFIFKSNQQNDTQDRLTTAQHTLDLRDARIEQLTSDLNSTRTRLTNTQLQLSGSQHTLTTTTADKQVISQCLRLVIQMLNAIADQNQSRLDTLTTQAQTPCLRAQRLI